MSPLLDHGTAAPGSGPDVIGIDIGGSKTHGLRMAGNRRVAEAFSGSANASSVGLAEAAHQLELLAARLGDRPVGAVCAGAGGADSPEAERRMHGLVQRNFPDARVRIVHDSELVLAAGQVQSGAGLVAGTGSVVWGRNDAGEQARAGGWGYLLGDGGSAYGVVRAAIQHTLRLADEGLAPDALARELLATSAAHSAGELLDRFYRSPSRREWAARAGLVFVLAEAGDPVATQIVAAAAADLSEAVLQVCRRLSLAGPVLMAGGLLVHQPLLQDAVRAELAGHGVDDVRLLDRDPVYGAVVLAQALATAQR